jgi:hypothetical protein
LIPAIAQSFTDFVNALLVIVAFPPFLRGRFHQPEEIVTDYQP